MSETWNEREIVRAKYGTKNLTSLGMKKRWVLARFAVKRDGSKWTELPAAWSDAGRLVMPPVAYGPGCYAIYADGELVYVGMTDHMNVRVSSHMNNRAAALERALGRKTQAWVVKYRPERFYGERATLEMRLIRRLKPILNRNGIARRRVSELPPVNNSQYRYVKAGT